MSGQAFFSRLTSLLSSTRIFSNSSRLQIHTQPQLCATKQARDTLESLKIPEKPKRPPSSYLRFINDHRETIRRQHPDWHLTKVTQKCAEDWRNAPPTLKEKYESSAKKELDEYARIHMEYMANLSEEQKGALKDLDRSKRADKSKRKKKQKARQLNKPKRPLGPYILYLMEQKENPANKSKSLIQLSQEVKDTWGSLSDVEKGKYALIAEEKKKVYDIELKLWEKEMIKEGNLDLVRKKTLDNPSLNNKSNESAAKKTVKARKVVKKTSE